MFLPARDIVDSMLHDTIPIKSLDDFKNRHAQVVWRGWLMARHTQLESFLFTDK